MGWKDSVEGLRRFASAPWFPIMVGMLSGANMFTLVLSGPLVVLFCSAVLANNRGWLFAAVANAVGTVAGCYALVLLVEARGVGFVKETFPSTFQSKWWTWTEGVMQVYGPIAAVPVAVMPIILHPLIVFAKLSNMGNAELLISILVGRVIKYCIMAQAALSFPRALRFFGASQDTIDAVKKSS